MRLTPVQYAALVGRRGRTQCPTCPHCRAAILPEDIATADGGLRMHTVSTVLERQRRESAGGDR